MSASVAQRDLLHCRTERYRLTAFLGSGAYSSVWRGEALDGGPAVALKLSPAASGRTMAEWNQVGSLAHHGLVRLLGAPEPLLDEAEPPLLVQAMELGGPSLHALTRPNRPLDEAALRRLMRCLGGGLACLHAAGLVHHDVKPANVLAFGDTFKLGDFGFVRSPGGTYRNRAGWTPTISAPERFANPTARDRVCWTPAFDLWAAGMTLAAAGLGMDYWAWLNPRIGGQPEAKRLYLDPDARMPPPEGPAILREAFLACTRKLPEQRCSGAELAAMAG